MHSHLYVVINFMTIRAPSFFHLSILSHSVIGYVCMYVQKEISAPYAISTLWWATKNKLAQPKVLNQIIKKCVQQSETKLILLKDPWS